MSAQALEERAALIDTLKEGDVEVIERAPVPFPTTPGAIIWAHLKGDILHEWILTDDDHKPWMRITGWGTQQAYASQCDLTLFEVRRDPGQVPA